MIWQSSGSRWGPSWGMNRDVRVGKNYLNPSAIFMHMSMDIKPLNLVSMFVHGLPSPGLKAHGCWVLSLCVYCIDKGRPQLTLIPTLMYLEFPFLCGQRGVQKTKPKERMENGHPDQHKQVIKRLFSLTVGAECSTSLPCNRFWIEQAAASTVRSLIWITTKIWRTVAFISQICILHFVSFDLLRANPQVCSLWDHSQGH